VCLGPAERARHGGQGPRDLGGAAFGEFHPVCGKEHVYPAAVERVGGPPEEASFFGAVDEAGDRRLVQSEVVRQLVKAAVVSSFGAPPRYLDFPDPVAAGDDEIVVDVLAAGPHPRVRSQAGGSHYTSTGELPLVPGVDGVGRGPDGLLRYFILPDTTLGAMAEQTVIDTCRSIVLPSGSDPVAVATAMNPAMSSWIALRQRSRPGKASSSSVPPATRARWPFRSRNCPARTGSSPPA
jgi:hypothetical protein